uniref:Uncharacterized protein n=1 Tax=Oryzias latipes TaxID=8090 RepID=A0A3B3I6S6_ORYLA
MKLLSTNFGYIKKFSSCTILRLDDRHLQELICHFKSQQNSVSSEEDTWPTEHWYEPFLCSYTLDRLFSFSILNARVFAAGDPAQHTASSAQKCM